MADTATYELSTSQKAAAVIVSLGADKASLLYQFMEPEDLEQLTLEVARLGSIVISQVEMGDSMVKGSKTQPLHVFINCRISKIMP